MGGPDCSSHGQNTPPEPPMPPNPPEPVEVAELVVVVVELPPDPEEVLPPGRRLDRAHAHKQTAAKMMKARYMALSGWVHDSAIRR